MHLYIVRSLLVNSYQWLVDNRDPDLSRLYELSSLFYGCSVTSLCQTNSLSIVVPSGTVLQCVIPGLRHFSLGNISVITTTSSYPFVPRLRRIWFSSSRISDNPYPHIPGGGRISQFLTVDKTCPPTTGYKYLCKISDCRS